MTEVNSPSGHSTRAPGRSSVTAIPTSADTCAPVATHSMGAPTIFAKASRAADTWMS